MAFEVHALTEERWDDFAELFGPRGGCAGCWCMLPRLTRREWEAGKGRRNRDAMRRIVRSGEVPGLLAYRNGEAVAWCAVAPRESYPMLARSRVMRPVDDKPVWSVVCLFVGREHRRQGVSVRLLREAARYVAARGGRVVEGYPVEPKQPSMPDAFAWYGTAAAFRAAGFREVARHSPTRPVMRRSVRPARRRA